MSDFRPRLKGKRKKAFKYLTNDERRILCIGDLHLPFSSPRYLQHCRDTYDRFNCNEVVFIGDIIDNAAVSYYEKSTKALGAENELSKAIDEVQKWAKVFPKATVTIGNHDRLVARKANSGSIPRQWIRSYNEVLGTSWDWVERVVIDGVQYVHGEGGTAKTVAKNDMQSTVQGHRHTEAYVHHFTGNDKAIFACQVGCGINREKYSFEYSKHYKKQAISCAVIIGGHTAFNVMLK